GKGWPNGFQLVELDLPNRSGAVHFRKWSHYGRFWACGSDIYRDAADGVLPYSLVRGQETDSANEKSGCGTQADSPRPAMEVPNEGGAPAASSADGTALRTFLYISEAKLSALFPQVAHHGAWDTEPQHKLNDFALPSQLQIVERYIADNCNVGDVNSAVNAEVDYIADSLNMIGGIIRDGVSSYVYFGDTGCRVALVGSPIHMIGPAVAKESKSEEFSFYLLPHIIRCLRESSSGDLLLARQRSDLGYNNFALHIERVNRNLGGPPQKLSFLAKPLYQFSDCVLATPLYVAF
ncbi:MAG: SAVMC3_10250 family protein, partial [Candidatus Thiodiazotropha sp.]